MDLQAEIDRAIIECTAENPEEEQGGLIFVKDGDYLFRKIRNQNAGTDSAPYLYVTDLTELPVVFSEVFGKGWKFFASFHTHPKFSPTPSNIDMTMLFKSFAINFIHSVSENRTVGYKWKNSTEVEVWNE